MKAITLTFICITVFLITLISCNQANPKEVTTTREVTAKEEEVTQKISEEKTTSATAVKEEATEEAAAKEPMNLLDEQAKIYTDVFGKLGGVEELQGIEGYMDLVKKMDASPETKKQLTAQYKLYANSLDPEKKEALKKQLLEALKPKN